LQSCFFCGRLNEGIVVPKRIVVLVQKKLYFPLTGVAAYEYCYSVPSYLMMMILESQPARQTLWDRSVGQRIVLIGRRRVHERAEQSRAAEKRRSVISGAVDLLCLYEMLYLGVVSVYPMNVADHHVRHVVATYGLVGRFWQD
jgi:hypothetical protein